VNKSELRQHDFLSYSLAQITAGWTALNFCTLISARVELHSWVLWNNEAKSRKFKAVLYDRTTSQS